MTLQPVRVYRLQRHTLELADLTGPSLDAVSLQLPNGVYTSLRTYERQRIAGLSAHFQRLNDSRAALYNARAVDLNSIQSALRAVAEREDLPAALIASCPHRVV